MESKKMVRIEDGQQLAGVCTGLAQYFGIDVAMVRIAFVIGALAGGPALLAYIVFWVALPIGSAAEA